MFVDTVLESKKKLSFGGKVHRWTKCLKSGWRLVEGNAKGRAEQTLAPKPLFWFKERRRVARQTWDRSFMVICCHCLKNDSVSDATVAIGSTQSWNIKPIPNSSKNTKESFDDIAFSTAGVCSKCSHLFHEDMCRDGYHAAKGSLRWWIVLIIMGVSVFGHFRKPIIVRYDVDDEDGFVSDIGT